MLTLRLLVLSLVTCATSMPAHSDQLDDITSSGKLRCGVQLDFPPNGFRDKDNQPIGFDVDYCNDLATALGVATEIVETPSPDRIPALISGRVDVSVSVASDTLERARTIGFSIPYFVFENVVLTRTDVGIEKPDDLAGHVVGGPAGATETLALEQAVKAWANPQGKLLTFQLQSDTFLALGQGQIDATWTTSTIASELIKSGKYPNLKIVGKAPTDPEYVALMVLRQEQGLLNYINLFLNWQVRSGRYAELYEKWIGSKSGPVPDLTVQGVYR